MAVPFDPEKNAKNIAERGLSFERVAELDWDTAMIAEDTRRDYGEPRLLVMARLDGRLHAAVVTPRGEDLHVISFRRANKREAKRYGKRDDERPGLAPRRGQSRMVERRFQEGASRGGRAAGIYWRKGDAGVDAPRPWQAAEGGQKGQPDAAARPGCARGIPAGGERLAGAHQ